MRGLIYKEVQLFIRTIDKKLVVFAVAGLALTLAKGGLYSGLLSTLILAMIISIQNIMNFSSDEKNDWKRYQLTLPVSNMRVVASKYLSLFFTLSLSILGSVALNVISDAIYSNFDITLLRISVIIAVLIPLVWTGIEFPLMYWFGFRSA